MSKISAPVVLIHGFGFDQRIWSPVELAFEGRKVIYLSLPGFGKDTVTAPYSISGLAAGYWNQIKDASNGPVHLIGHSMGGYVCLEMFAQMPSEVASIGLIHSHVYADTAEKKEARTTTMKEIRSGGHESFIQKFIPPLLGSSGDRNEIAKMLIRRGMGYHENAWYFGLEAIRDRADHSATLKNSTVPVLMLMGEEDKAVPAELAYKQASLPERSSFKMYPGVGHLGMFENTSGMIGDLIRFQELFD